jgi:hypothetical protein
VPSLDNQQQAAWTQRTQRRLVALPQRELRRTAVLDVDRMIQRVDAARSAEGKVELRGQHEVVRDQYGLREFRLRQPRARFRGNFVPADPMLRKSLEPRQHACPAWRCGQGRYP